AQKEFDQKEAQKLQKKIKSDSFDLEDFRQQLQQVKNMGNLSDLVGMIPGAGKALQHQEIDEESFKPIEAIIDSMTPEERHNPDMLHGTHRRRIAKGSGTSVREINDLMKQFKQMKKMMKSFSGMGKMGQIMQSMKGAKNLPFN